MKKHRFATAGLRTRAAILRRPRTEHLDRPTGMEQRSSDAKTANGGSTMRCGSYASVMTSCDGRHTVVVRVGKNRSKPREW
jgi:hypothetical protein